MAFEETIDGGDGAAPLCDRFWQQLVADFSGHVERSVAATMRSFGWPHRPEEVEDIAQNVWLHLCERRPESMSRWRTWERARLHCYLSRMAHNAVVDELRRRRAAKRGGGRRVEALDAEDSARELDLLAGFEQNPEERVLAEERSAMLRGRLAPMLGGGRSHRDAGILVLAVVEERTTAEIAALFEGALAPSSVYTVVHRARSALARRPVEDVMGALGLAAGSGERAPGARAIG